MYFSFRGKYIKLAGYDLCFCWQFLFFLQLIFSLFKSEHDEEKLVLIITHIVFVFCFFTVEF